MIAKLVLLLMVFWGTLSATRVQPLDGAPVGDWSAAAFAVWGIASNQRADVIRIPSPNKKFSLLARQGNLTADWHTASRPIYLDAVAEVRWAPDSLAFFITRSDGGWVGTWYVRVVQAKDQSLREIDVTREAVLDFRQKISKCLEERSNVAAIDWVEGSSRLLLVVESPSHSSCPDMGNIRGYVVDAVSGKIMARHDKEALRSKYGRVFGQRLKDKYHPEFK